MEILSEVFDHIPIPCYHLNHDGKITHINLLAIQLFSIKKEDVVGRNYQSIFLDKLNEGYYLAISYALAQNELASLDNIRLSQQNIFKLIAKPIKTGVMVFLKEIEPIITADGQEAQGESRIPVKDNGKLFSQMNEFLYQESKNESESKLLNNKEGLFIKPETAQQEIFRIKQYTAEAERRRIAESLHSGLAQLLYGIKLNLAVLDPKLAIQDARRYLESKNYINELLEEAIKETRRISHELIPSVLVEYGLERAIDEVCMRLQPGIKFNCIVAVDHGSLESYLELAAFRTVQELMLNVVKHAEASYANVNITVNKNELMIQVKDDGKGMPDSPTEKKGIGLASIRHKVERLKGSLKIKSAPGRGTAVEVCFPISAA